MTHLLLMLAMAVAIALLREPMGRDLVKAVDAIDWKWAVILAILALAVWGILQHFQGPVGPITGDAIAGLFDAVTYGDLLIGVTVAILNRQTQQLLGRVADLAHLAGHMVRRLAGRAPAARTSPKPRRRTPDRDEPEPASWNGVLAFV